MASRCTFLPLHAPDIPPYTRHQALTLSLLTFTRVWVNIGRLCVCDTLENTNIEKRAVFAGVNSLSCLARPNTSSRPCDGLRFLSQNMSNVQIPSWFLACIFKSLRLFSWHEWHVQSQGPRMDVWLCTIRSVQITQCLFKPNSLKVPPISPRASACPDHVQSDPNLWHLFSNCFYLGTNQW